jgi:excisionase family DNA binding protein
MASFYFPADHPGVVLEGCVTAEAASELTGYSIQHLRRLTLEGRLDALRVGRSWLIKIKSLEAYIEAGEARDSRFGPRVPAQMESANDNASA